MTPIPIRSFRPVISRSDSTEIGSATLKAENIVFRPEGAFKSPPRLLKPWGFGTTQSPFATFDALTHPSGVGTVGASDETICVRIYHQGINLVMFFNMWTGTVDGASVSPGERGTFYIGNDGTFADSLDFTDSGPPLFEVLAVGLDPRARWYGEVQHGQVFAQNGVDDAVVIQLGRTLTPGKYRKRGSNARPATPVLTAIEPVASTNTQAKRTVTGRAGGVDLVFTAHPENFQGQYGNLRIRVKISYGGIYSTGPITSQITGDGTLASPYLYTIQTTVANSSNNAIIAFVNADSLAIPILTASGANATADTFDDDGLGNTSGVFLSGGLGTGVSTGLTNETTDIYARYWDGGHRNCGYEAPSSEPSNEITLDGTTYKDLLVQVDIDESAEGGRFSHSNAGIRIYKRHEQDVGDDVWNLMNEDAPLPNTHRPLPVFGVPSTLPLWTRSGQITAQYSSYNNYLTITGTVSAGDVLFILESSIGLTSGTRLYVISVLADTPSAGQTRFKVSLTSGGSEIDIGVTYAATAVAATDELTITGTVTNGQSFRVGTNSVNLPVNTDLFVIDAVTTLGSTTFKASLTNGGSAINLTPDGSVTIHMEGSGIILQTGTLSPNRFYAHSTSFAALTGTTSAGADTVQIATTVADGTLLIAQTSAQGIPQNVKLYVVQAAADTPSAGQTTFKLSLTSGGTPIDITGSGSISFFKPVTNQWSTSDIITLPSGGGASAPTGLSLDTRYNITSLDADGFGVQIATSRLGSVADMTSSGSSLTMRVVAVMLVIGTNSEPGRGMSPDQNRPIAHKYVTLAGNINWSAGIPGSDTKIYFSKEFEYDEVAPEGVILDGVEPDAPLFISLGRGGANSVVSGLWSDKQLLHVHYNDGIVIIDPATPDNKQEPLITSGMVNGACVTTGDANRIVFLGANRLIMEINGARYGNRASAAVAAAAAAYINGYTSNDEIVNHPEKCSILHDRDGKMLYFWLPDDDGGIIGFAYDELLDGIVGPFTAPCVASSAVKLEDARGKYLIANPDGYLFYWDVFQQGDVGDLLGQDAITTHETTDPLPADHNGYDYSDIPDGDATKRLWYSTHAVLESGLMDAGTQGVIKRFVGLRWRSVSGSRGFVRVKAMTTSGQTKTIWYGEMGAKYRKHPHQASFSISDTAIKIIFEVFSAENKTWTIRDCELLVE